MEQQRYCGCGAFATHEIDGLPGEWACAVHFPPRPPTPPDPRDARITALETERTVLLAAVDALPSLIARIERAERMVALATPLVEAANRWTDAWQDAGEFANGGRANPNAPAIEKAAEEALRDAASHIGDPYGTRWREWTALFAVLDAVRT